MSQDLKTYTFAGVSRRNGTFKVRFANDAARVKVLAKTGSSDIDLIELPRAMTKAEAIQTLIKADFDRGNKEIRAALEAGLDTRVEKHKAEKVAKSVKSANTKAEKPKTVKAPAVKTKPTMDSIKAKAAAVRAKSAVVQTAAEVPVQTFAEAKEAVTAELTDEDAPF